MWVHPNYRHMSYQRPSQLALHRASRVHFKLRSNFRKNTSTQVSLTARIYNHTGLCLISSICDFLSISRTHQFKSDFCRRPKRGFRVWQGSPHALQGLQKSLYLLAGGAPVHENFYFRVRVLTLSTHKNKNPKTNCKKTETLASQWRLRSGSGPRGGGGSSRLLILLLPTASFSSSLSAAQGE